MLEILHLLESSQKVNARFYIWDNIKRQWPFENGKEKSMT